MSHILINIYGREGVVAQAKVSPEDASLVAPYRWYLGWNKARGKSKAYAICRLPDGHMVKMHRMIMGVTDPKQLVDHINNDPLDNRKSNLRLANPQQNQSNQGIRKNNKSGYKGVSFHKASGKWQATISVDGKSKGLGLFLTPEEAHKAYCEAAKKYHGEFHNVGA